MIVMPGIMRGRRTVFDGFVMDLMSSTFRATVPTAQSRTFLETHVYTGAPKLTLKGDGNIGWNRHNYLKFSPLTQAFTAAGSTPPTVAGSASFLGQDCSSVTFSSAMTPGFAGCRATASYAASASITSPISTGSVYVSLSRALTGSESLELYMTGSGTGTLVTINSGNSSSYVGSFTRVTLPLSLTGSYSPAIQLAGAISGSNVTVYFNRGQINLGSTALEYLENLSSNSPLLDEPTIFNTSGTRLGILLEPAATNNAQYSQAFSTGGYTGSNYTIGAAAATAPDGTVTGGRFTETAITAARFCYSSAFNGTGGVVYTESIYVKAGVGRTAFFLNIQQSATNYITAVFDLSASAETGTATETSVGSTSGTLTATRYEKLPNGWYRLSITGSTAGANSFCFGSAPATTGNTFTTLGVISFAGSTSNYFDAWGFQVETGSVATSYIPTTTASVTRTADSCKRILGPEWNASAGTGVVRVIPNQSSGNKIAFEFDDAGTSNRLLAYIENSTNSVLVRSDLSGSNRGPATPGTATIGSANTIAFAWSAANYAASVNGGAATTSSTAGALPTCTQVRYDDGTQGNQTNVRLRYYAERLSNADVVTLSGGGSISTQPTLDFNYATGVYTYTPVNAGVTTTYSLSTLISSGLMTLTGTPSAKWVRGSNGLLTEVAAGNLAIEYDVNGNVLGCINTEPARTNQCLRSDELSNASWTPVNATVTADQANGPTGAATLDLLKENTATAGHSLQLPSTTTTVQSYVLSCFARVGPGSRHIMLYGLNMDGRGVGFNLTNGTTFTVGGISLPTLAYGIEDWGGGLYRCYAGFTGAATTGAAGGIYLVSGTTFSYTGDNTSGAYVGSVQLEAGTYPSSYIPTTTASVTRNADVWTLNLGSWFDNSKWIVASKVYAPRANMATDGPAATMVAALELASGTTSYSLNYVNSTNSLVINERVGGVTGATFTNNALTFPAVLRAGFGYSPSNVKASVNGATQATTGTPSPIQASFTKIGVGVWANDTVSNPRSGGVYIQSLNILPVVPTQDNVNQYASGA